MIQVENLTKHYGAIKAIDGVSFEVRRGEVLGFLGPNGAGKTTTMRILCGCIGATAGRAMVDGQDVLDHPRSVKQKIGYLPETPPLYDSMIVRDYLRFAARIKDVDAVEAAVDRVVGQTGLSEMQERIVGHLSKGYRQRVGLAQALVHEPELLVLDEPTNGLDPAQRKEIRNLLAELAEGDRTVILSTHVLGEIEAVCQRVIIINQGRVVAQDRIDVLAGGGQQVRVNVARPGENFPGVLQAIDGVLTVEAASSGGWLVRCDDDRREAIAAAAVPHGLLELASAQRLEDIYLRLTAGAPE
jgi:ABC-2 type transport system ATP-binding protein